MLALLELLPEKAVDGKGGRVHALMAGLRLPGGPDLAGARKLESTHSEVSGVPRIGRFELIPVIDLPEPSTPLVGRTDAVEEIAALLLSPGARMVTLTGPGGIGKTRLAIETAQRLSADFPDGIRFVDLTPLDNHAAVLPEIAQRLGVRDWGDQPLAVSIRSFLRDRKLLLVLDNFERVIDAAPAVADALSGCPGVVALVTSRTVLRLNMERSYSVPTLALPVAGGQFDAKNLLQFDAAKLFVDRASFAQPSFALTDANAPMIAEIARRLDGLPLALELAAARMRVLPPLALLNRLERRLPVLTDGPRDLPERQQTLRRAIAWSYDLLSADEQLLFGRLAVFSGGFDLDAVEQVMAAVPADTSGGSASESPFPTFEVVASLLEKSLLQHAELAGIETTGVPRFRMLETVREFALEQLEARGDVASVRHAHAGVYLELAKRFARSAWVPQTDPTIDQLETEHANIRSALQWFEQNDHTDLHLEMVANLWWFWSVRGYLREGREWIERALQRSTDGDAHLRALSHIGLGRIWHYQGDEIGAAANYGQALTIGRASGDPLSTIFALCNLGALSAYQQEYDRAMDYDEEALLLMSSFSDRELARSLTNATLSNLGYTHRGLGEWELAEARLSSAIAGFREMEYAWGLVRALHHAGGLSRTRGDLRSALDRYRECFEQSVATGDGRMITGSLIGLATIAGAVKEPAEVARLLGAADATQARLGATFVVSPLDQPALEAARSMSEQALGTGLFDETRAAGEAWSQGELLQHGLEAIQRLNDRLNPQRSESHISLSARELDVVPLLVAGLSDKEIADRLFISTRTAQGHVASIIAKLGVHNRTAAATAAVAAGLVRQTS